MLAGNGFLRPWLPLRLSLRGCRAGAGSLGPAVPLCLLAALGLLRGPLMRQGMSLELQVVVKLPAAGTRPLIAAHVAEQAASPARPLLGLRLQPVLQPVLHL